MSDTYKSQKYQVTCIKDPSHVFDKIIQVDTTKNEESDMICFCPFCETEQKFTIKGRIVPNSNVTREL